MKACPAMTTCAVRSVCSPSHRPQPLFELAVVSLDRIVRVPLHVVPCRGNQLIKHPRVNRRGVSDHLGRLDFEHGDRPLEEPPSCSSVSAGRHQHVDDLSMLVDRPVHIPPDPVDLDVGLIHAPPVTRRVTGKTRGVGQQRSAPLHPPVHGDVIDLDTAFDQQFLYILIGQVVAEIPADSDDDHLWWEPEPGKRRLRRRPQTRTARQPHSPSLS
jgi:hypothetical protein